MNGPAYNPQTNLIPIGEVDWCATVTMQNDEQIQEVKLGKPWSDGDAQSLSHLSTQNISSMSRAASGAFTKVEGSTANWAGRAEARN